MRQVASHPIRPLGVRVVKTCSGNELRVERPAGQRGEWQNRTADTRSVAPLTPRDLVPIKSGRTFQAQPGAKYCLFRIMILPYPLKLTKCMIRRLRERLHVRMRSIDNLI
jgi:hypothetical protein